VTEIPKIIPVPPTVSVNRHSLLKGNYLIQLLIPHLTKRTISPLKADFFVVVGAQIHGFCIGYRFRELLKAPVFLEAFGGKTTQTCLVVGVTRHIHFKSEARISVAALRTHVSAVMVYLAALAGNWMISASTKAVILSP
jgi:hypothetical protein